MRLACALCSASSSEAAAVDGLAASAGLERAVTVFVETHTRCVQMVQAAEGENVPQGAEVSEDEAAVQEAGEMRAYLAANASLCSLGPEDPLGVAALQLAACTAYGTRGTAMQQRAV